MPLATAFDDYLEEHGPNLASTARPEKSRKAIMQYMEGKGTVADWTPSTNLAYINWRKAQGVKGSSIKRELTDLRSALNHEVKMQRLDYAPKIITPKDSPPRDIWLRMHQAPAFYEALPNRWDKLFMIIALMTAQRKGAIQELKWERVDFETRLIYFNPEGREQNNKFRVVVPISDLLYEILWRERASRPESEYVIEGKFGPILSENAFLVPFKKAREATELNGVTPHILKHTAATWMAMKGISRDERRIILGHANSQTDDYTHLEPKYLRKAVKALESCCAVFARNYIQLDVLNSDGE